MRAAQGGPVRNVVLGITGVLAALGNGQEPGVGSCHSYWVDHSDLEVLEATAGAVRRVRGGTGDLQLRIADGTFVWCTAHHCRPWRLEDGEPLAAASPPVLGRSDSGRAEAAAHSPGVGGSTPSRNRASRHPR